MELVSANIGLPREATWQGRSVTIAIGKQPVEARVALCKPNLVGNRQVDLSVHGARISRLVLSNCTIMTIGSGSYPATTLIQYSLDLVQDKP